jgi:quercetin dioxygenase-like cupin family protein
MKVFPLLFPTLTEGYLKQLVQIDDKMVLKMGTVFFKAGVRIPETGLKANFEHEISIIVEGSIKAITVDGEQIIRAGEIIQFAPNEMQGGEILEDCKIIWVLLGK